MVFTVCHSTKHFKKQLYKKQNLSHEMSGCSLNFSLLGYLPLVLKSPVLVWDANYLTVFVTFS